jgi:hypothetical protein
VIGGLAESLFHFNLTGESSYCIHLEAQKQGIYIQSSYGKVSMSRLLSMRLQFPSLPRDELENHVGIVARNASFPLNDKASY